MTRMRNLPQDAYGAKDTSQNSYSIHERFPDKDEGHLPDSIHERIPVNSRCLWCSVGSAHGVILPIYGQASTSKAIHRLPEGDACPILQLVPSWSGQQWSRRRGLWSVIKKLLFSHPSVFFLFFFLFLFVFMVFTISFFLLYCDVSWGWLPVGLLPVYVLFSV